MTTKCLSCGHLNDEVQLNCSQCGSFYTEIIVDEKPPQGESKIIDVIDKIKFKLKQIMPHGISHD